LLNADAQLLKIKNAISDASDKVASASESLNDLMGRDVQATTHSPNWDTSPNSCLRAAKILTLRPPRTPCGVNRNLDLEVR